MKNISAQEQRKRFRCFSKAHFTYTGRMPLALPVMLAFPSIVFCSTTSPMEVMGWFIPFCLAWIISDLLLSPYLQAIQQAQPQIKQQEICHIMQYLPISAKQIRRELTVYLWGFLWKYSLIAVLCRSLTSCITGDFRISYLLFILFMTLILPMGFGILKLRMTFRP